MVPKWTWSLLVRTGKVLDYDTTLAYHRPRLYFQCYYKITLAFQNNPKQFISTNEVTADCKTIRSEATQITLTSQEAVDALHKMITC